MQSSNATILALDVGEQRIGVAEATMVARIAHPLKTLQHTDAILQDIVELVQARQAVGLVLGLPRSLDGHETAQTRYVERFGEQLKRVISVPLYWQDEAVTSRKAREELELRGKPYAKGDIDALAAAYILEDFLQEQGARV